MDDRERRLLVNETTFREVNERIEDLTRSFNEITETIDIVCECSAMTCVDRVILAVDAYERVRTDPALFIVVNGHENLGIETVDHAGRYTVVRKFDPEAVAVAMGEDSRS